MPLSPLDLAALLLYLAAVLVIGARCRRATSANEFMLAGRELSLPLFVGTLVATWYGGILGVTEIAFRDGLAAWLTQGGFWYVSYLIFAFGIAERLARSQHTTLPDQVAELHGERARQLAAALNYLNVVPVAYVLSLGILLQLLLDLPLPIGIALGAGLSVLYSIWGGFRAVVYTDLLQFALMCAAVALALLYAVSDLGGAAYLRAHLPPGHLRPTGQMGAQELFVWATIALSTLVDPNFYHRCYAARTPAVARRGVLISVAIWLLFDVCTTFGGLYARAAMPTSDPRLAYPLLALRLLPPGLKGLFLTGLFATVMSTIDSYCFVGALALSHDRHKGAQDDGALVRRTRWGIAFTAALAAGLSFVFGGSFKTIWKTLGSLSTNAMLVPVAIGLTGWRPAGAGFAAMVGGSVGTLGWALLRGLGLARAQSLEPLIVGLALSVGSYLVIGLTARSSR